MLIYRRYWASLRRRWWLPVIGVIVAPLVATIVYQLSARQYESTARLIVGPTSASASYDNLAIDQQFVKTYAELATTRPLLEAVIAKLDLPIDPLQLAQRVKVRSTSETRLLDVTAEADGPAQAAMIANAVGAQLVLLGAGGEGVNDSVRTNVQSDLDTIRDALEQTQRELTDSEQELAAAPPSSMDPAARVELVSRRDKLRSTLSDLQRTRASMYDTLLRVSSTTGTVKVVAPATPPPTPKGFGLAQTLLLVAPMALAVGAGLALMLDMLDPTIRTASGLPVGEWLPYLGSVPRFSRPFGPAMLVARSRPTSRITESYRAIRTALLAMLPTDQAQVLMVTSPRQGDGKTTLVANLAVLLTQIGKRVVLVDADFRRPTLHLIFDVSNDAGLSDVLRLRLPPELNLIETGIDGLRLLSSGSPVLDPADLLASAQIDQVISSLRQTADVVLVDAPPVLSVTDAAVLAPRMGRVLLVAAAGRTTGEEVARSRAVLLTSGATLAGIVLTRAEEGLDGPVGLGSFGAELRSADAAG